MTVDEAMLLRMGEALWKGREIKTGANAVTSRHRSKYLLLVIDFLRRYLELHLDLVDQVEREFSASPRPRNTSDSALT